MEGEQLHRDDCQNALQAIHCVGDLHEITRTFLRLRILLVTNDNRAPLEKPIHKQRPQTLERRVRDSVRLRALLKFLTPLLGETFVSLLGRLLMTMGDMSFGLKLVRAG
ncbi:hypothetical protein BaRGS_00002031 [Batillaria attramentaria]|uniref:Uncharacterized protein n=1 Tax=Batillaria attramentaria TaxID=370345 RepID=A0ABD0M4T4_9CAEN